MKRRVLKCRKELEKTIGIKQTGAQGFDGLINPLRVLVQEVVVNRVVIGVRDTGRHGHPIRPRFGDVTKRFDIVRVIGLYDSRIVSDLVISDAEVADVGDAADIGKGDPDAFVGEGAGKGGRESVVIAG